MDNSLWLLAPGLVTVLAVSAWLSVIDVREHRLPNRIVGPLAAGVAIWLVALGLVTSQFERTIAAIGWGCAGFAAFFVLYLVAGMGAGDVKYAWPVCATVGWFGWSSLRVALFGLIFSGGLVGLIAQLNSRGSPQQIAYGPFMAFGLFCGIARGLIGAH